MLKKGQKAPNFKLKNDEGKEKSLSDYKGKKVILYFYPKDDTAYCTKEACNFRDKLEEFKENGAQIIGVSYDTPEDHQKFKEKYRLNYELLSDVNKDAAVAYGAYDHQNPDLPKRITYLIDEEGDIVNTFGNVDVINHADEILKIL
ncbi:peroxiredoxin [Candidatus Dependentiae bacterium]|nr:peroxiredoxin [Candidatus Dependentiae bacterium]